MKGADSPSSLRVALQISVTLLVKIHWGWREPSMLTAKNIHEQNEEVQRKGLSKDNWDACQRLS